MYLSCNGYDIVLDKFDLTAKGEGEDGLGQADIIANYKGRKYHGSFLQILLKHLGKPYSMLLIASIVPIRLMLSKRKYNCINRVI